jgi:alpha/beta superfamily hydrolase
MKINEIKDKKSVQRINETKSFFFEKVNKIAKSLTNLMRRMREKT